MLVVAAVLLRVRFTQGYAWRHGFDVSGHLDLIRLQAETSHVPVNHPWAYLAYNPPLYYDLAGWLQKRGWTNADLQMLSAWTGAARVLLVWWALRRWVTSPIARLVALAFIAFLPAGVHMDALISNEPLHATLAVAALVVCAEIIRLKGAARPEVIVLGGLLLGLALLTKISVLTTFATLGLIAATALVRPGWQRVGRQLALAVALGALVGVPMHALRRIPGTPLFPTMYDVLPSVKERMAAFEKTPRWQRRPLAYYGFSGTSELLLHPFAPTLQEDGAPRYWPVLAVGMVVDYWGFYFSGEVGEAATPYRAKRRAIPIAAFFWARVSAACGLALFLLLAIATPIVLLRELRRDRLAVLLLVLPWATALAGLAFCVTYPLDDWGLVKGIYVQFALLPLGVLYGRLVSTLAARGRVGAALAALAVVPIAVFVRYDVTRWW